MNAIGDNNEGEWMKALHRGLRTRLGDKVPRNGWPVIAEYYSQKFQVPTTVETAKNKYHQLKRQERDQTMPQVSSQVVVIPQPTVPPPPTNITSEQANVQQQLYDELQPRQVRDAKLYIRIKNTLEQNIIKCRSHETERVRTKKIYSKDINHEVIKYINIALDQLNIPGRTNTLEEVGDVLYACQLTYASVEEKARTISNWKESMVNKISRLRREFEILKAYNPSSSPSDELKVVCAKNKIHSNNPVQIAKLTDVKQEKIAIYEKKVKMADRRMNRKVENRRFEFNRATFYRNIDGSTYKISDQIDKHETLEFWRELWRGDDNGERDHNILVETFEECTVGVEIDEPSTIELVKRVVRTTGDWKAPGPDMVYNFFIKRIEAMHERFVQLVVEAVKEPDRIDTSFYQGLTHLLPKVEKASTPDQLRPITCLSNIYKIVSKVVAERLHQICEINEVVSVNQMGTRRRCQGAKELALTNKTLNSDNSHALKSSWVDIRKAYDSVNHEYLLKVLNKLALPPEMIKFVERMLAHQSVTLAIEGIPLGTAMVANGILQGDSLSPLLFVIAMEPVSRRLNEIEKVSIESQLWRNHLIFIDDIKLLAKDERTLKKLCACTKESLEVIGFNINQAKSASNIDDEQVFGRVVDDQNGYKYMGILENSANTVMEANKIIIRDKIESRVKKLCTSKLTARNLFHAFNEWAISVMNYYVGIVDFTPDEVKEMDLNIRKILVENKVTRIADNKQRLYLPRRELGRGLQNISDRWELTLLKLDQYLMGKNELMPIVQAEHRAATMLGIIKEYLGAKYSIDNNITVDIIKDKQKETRMEEIKEKPMHRRLFDMEDNRIDMKMSTQWLKQGEVSPQEESVLCKLQDRNILFRRQKCPRCKAKAHSVEHVATGCGALLHGDYIRRHNEVVKIVHYHVAKSFGVKVTKSLKGYVPEQVVVTDTVKIKADMPILTENRVECNKPDILVHDIRRNEFTIIEVGVTSKKWLNKTETTKGRKYEHLAADLRSMHPGATTRMVPIVLTWDGFVTDRFKKFAKEIGLTKQMVAKMQVVTLQRTRDCVMVDAEVIDEERSLDLANYS